MKSIIYIRTSTEEQNPFNQLEDCKTLLTDENFEVIEEKQSAYKSKDRLKFEDIKNQIKKGNVKHLICWDWDRLFRNRKKLKEFFVFCKLYKCEIHSFRQKFFEDFYKIPAPFDEIIQDLVLNLMGWLAEDESKKKSDRIRIAYKNRTKEWGRKPITKKVINEVLDLHKQGKTMREIASEVIYWDKCRNKHNISKSAVHKIIKQNQGINS